jgi:methylenetetrahydrofolate reductase (NADPH)
MTTSASNLLDVVTFEVIPLKGVIERARVLPAKTPVSITASPAKGLQATVDLALQLRELGYMVTPHISARMVNDRPELVRITRLLTEAGITDVLVVGGDADDYGKFKDSAALLREMADIGHSFAEVGITGYPEGHPFIPLDALRQAMLEKQRYATYVTTQMCFDPAAFATWLKDTRRDGVKLPVMVGVPGVVDPLRLARVAARIGVGTSIRYVKKNRAALVRMLRPGSYRPGKLVRALHTLDPSLGLVGLHLFTFNQVGPTWKWYEKAVETGRASRGSRR